MKYIADSEYKNLVNEYRSEVFVQTVQDFVESKIDHYFTSLLGTRITNVEVFGSGVTSIVFKITDSFQSLVFKFIDDKDRFWNEVLGYSYLESGSGKHLSLRHYDTLSEALHLLVIEYSDHQALSNYIESNPTDKQCITALSKAIQQLHANTVYGYGQFLFGTTNTEYSLHKQQKALVNSKLQEELFIYLLENKIIAQQDVYTVLDSLNKLDFTKPNSITHGDFHPGNCLYDSKTKSVFIFDFNTRAMNPLFDIARFNLSLLISGHKQASAHLIDLYNKSEYVELPIIQGIEMIKRLVKLHKRNQSAKLKILQNYFITNLRVIKAL